jgi:8-oxo-dGTP pyrophosphatase MutT (NUDIX family)
MMQDLENKFRTLENGKNAYEPVALRRAAVLVGLFSRDDEWHVLLTRRSTKLKSHSGQVCLPGGKTDEGETNIETALREANEEVGLPRDSIINILGELPPRLSAHLLSVTPVVCRIAQPILNRKRTRSSHITDTSDSFLVTPNPHEVESVFFVPLKLFSKSSLQHSFYDYETFYNHTVRIHEFQHTFGGTEYCIWGLTAHILIDAALRIYGNDDATSSVELDPPGLPRHVDLRVAKKKENDEEECTIEVVVCAE